MSMKKYKHSQKHINLIADYLAGVDLDLSDVQKARYLKENCKECKEFFEGSIKLDKLISTPDFQDRIWDVLKKEDPNKYDYLVNTLAKSEKGIDIILRNKIVKNRLADFKIELSKIDYATKKALLENLGILRTRTKKETFSPKSLFLRLSYASPLSADDIEKILQKEIERRQNRKGKNRG